MIFTFELDLDRVKVTQLARYLGERLFCPIVIIGTMHIANGLLYLNH